MNEAPKRRPFRQPRSGHPWSAVALGLTLALIASHVPRALAQTTLSEQRQQAIRQAVERVAHSTVRIETVGGLERVGEVLFGSGTTSGLIVSADGYILSSAFAFRNRPASILVHLPDLSEDSAGRRLAAQVVATDHARMLTLLKVEADVDLPVAEFASPDDLNVGQTTIALGRTFTPDEVNMAVGILSARNRIWGKAIQTDAAVSPNNYGGPLIDLHGRVLGLLVPLSPKGDNALAGHDWYDSGIGFAIPADQLQAAFERMKQGRDLHPGKIGFAMRGKNPAIAEAALAKVSPGSPAARAGLKKGDRIVAADGRPISRAAQVKEALARHYAGDTIRLTIARGEDEFEREIKLVGDLQPYAHPFIGILPIRDRGSSQDDSPQDASAPGREPKKNEATDDETDDPAAGDSGAESGVAVRWVYPESPAHGAGIEAGDVILKIDGQPISNRVQATDRLTGHQPGDTIKLHFRREGETRHAEVQLAALPDEPPSEAIPPATPSELPVEYVDGTIEVDGFDNAIHVFGPKLDQPEGQPASQGPRFGLLLWLHSSDGLKWPSLRESWAEACRRDRVILIAPEADGTRWHQREVEQIEKLLERAKELYPLDPARVVVAGRESGGAMASVAARQQRDMVRGVASVGAPLAGEPGENRADARLAYLMAFAEKSPYAPLIRQSIAGLREAAFPVAVWELGKEPRPLNREELDALARWIDTLDRL